ncbi:MAG: BNR-4 repeat-containing protein [Treponema sp.]|nr:BNR-4 repeat-containing protein [Treponema sp.]
MKKMKNKKWQWAFALLVAGIMIFASCDNNGGGGGNGYVNDGDIDTANLLAARNSAIQVLNHVVIVSNGNGVPNDVRWVPAMFALPLQTAIGLAESVLEDLRPTQAEIDDVIQLLVDAVDTLNDAASYGNAAFSGLALLNRLVEARNVFANAPGVITDATVDAPADVRWTPTTVANAFTTVINAQDTALRNVTSQDQITYGVAALDAAITAFNTGIRTGPGSVRLVRAGMGFAGNSTNNVPFRQSAMVTFQPEDGSPAIQWTSYFVENHTAQHSVLEYGWRFMHEPEYRLFRSDIVGRVNNAHNSPSMIVDGSGYIHVAINDHNQPLLYYRGPAPGVPPMAADRRFMIGTTHGSAAARESSVTYVEFYKLSNGNLLFFYRQGGSGSGHLVVNRWDNNLRRWDRMQDALLDGTNVPLIGGSTYSPYWQVFVDENDRVHVAWNFRETPAVETNANMFYAFSDDEGLTWQRLSDGAQHVTPIGQHNAVNPAQRGEMAWEIPRNRNLMNQTNMTAVNGIPMISTYFSLPNSVGTPNLHPMQYFVIFYHPASLGGTGWRLTQVSNRTFNDNTIRNPFLSGGGTITSSLSRPRMVARQVGDRMEAFFIARFQDSGIANLAAANATYDERRVSLFYTDDIFAPEGPDKWRHRFLTDFSVNFWEPSMDTCLWKEQSKLHIFVQNCRGSLDGVPDNANIAGAHDRFTTQVYTLIVNIDDLF